MDDLEQELLTARSGMRRQFSADVQKTLSQAVGLPMNSLHFSILLVSCVIGVVQYGIITVFGLITGDLEAYYHLSPGAGNQLYDTVQLGSCLLGFLPGMCYDNFGAINTVIVGTILGALPIFAQLDWTRFFPELDTLTGLNASFFMFGLSATFFQVIAVLAPLEAFPKQHMGKVSAIIQLCTSLGITIQSAIYAWMKTYFSDFVQAYYTYMVVCTVGVGAIMVGVFWEESNRLHRSKKRKEGKAIDTGTPDNSSEQVSFFKSVLSTNFAYMSFVFIGCAAFVYTYRDASGQINSAVGIPPSTGMFDWGIYGAIGRVGGNVLLDRTQAHRFGGPLFYIAASSLGFAAGLLCIVVPSVPGSMEVNILNCLAGIANGCFFGITAPALRLLFGSGSLGLIYGIMYVWVAVGMPFWSAQMPDTAVCHGATCFRTYCGSGAIAFIVTALVGILLMCRVKK